MPASNCVAIPFPVSSSSCIDAFAAMNESVVLRSRSRPSFDVAALALSKPCAASEFATRVMSLAPFPKISCRAVVFWKPAASRPRRSVTSFIF